MIDVRFLGHSTVLLDLGGVRVLTDPFLRGRLGPLQRHGAVPDPASLDVEVVVVSHGHPDHFDPASIEVLPGAPILVVPRGLGPKATRLVGASRVLELEAGGSVEVAGVRIAGVPARHWITPGAPRATPIGYVMERVGARAERMGPGGGRVYFAGDTGRYASMTESVGPVDLALLPVWTWGPHLGPGHLGPRMAAQVAAELSPHAVIPIHWATLYPRQLHRVWRGPLADPGHRFAAHVRKLAPAVSVHVLQPGDHVVVERP
ncbi:MAG TPA: MBL fold metallo-hydrolase [Candidatus Limnocylindrales bacterium]|nr:MBL fold metallo-hydrolase [Candidatus Limnocylindrales bacterium]